MKSIVKPTPGTSSTGNGVEETQQDALKSMTNRLPSHGGTTTGRRKVTFQDEIVFDDDTAVIVNRIIDQGEFRSVSLARDARTTDKQLYALKKVQCRDGDALEQCRKEAEIHRTFHHENIMPLLGIRYEGDSSFSSAAATVCYMLFPYIPRSLRDDITARRLLEDTLESKRRPYSKREALTVFAGIVSAVIALHGAGFSHRDLRVENILLKKKDGKRRDIGTPVLTDFGSVGPLKVPLRSWADVVLTTEDVDRHTTIAYRAPELFGGGLQYGLSEFLHYDYADVWSLGCLFFAILYGASPFEIEWRVSLVEGAASEGTVRFINCTYQQVLGPIPFPPGGSAADRRYGEDMKDLISWMLKKEGRERPHSSKVAERVGWLLDEEDKSSRSRKRRQQAPATKRT